MAKSKSTSTKKEEKIIDPKTENKEEKVDLADKETNKDLENYEADLKKEKEKKKEKVIKPDDIISLEQYCTTLSNTGPDRFALVRMQTWVAEGLIPKGTHTKNEWEKYYLELIKL